MNLSKDLLAKLIDINKDGLKTEECQDLAERLEIFEAWDIISILNGSEHSFVIGKDTKVKIKRN